VNALGRKPKVIVPTVWALLARAAVENADGEAAMTLAHKVLEVAEEAPASEGGEAG
jgi:hypothetical protein